MKYRKKPVVIEAIQWTGKLEDFDKVMNFAGDVPVGSTQGNCLVVFTLEGSMLARPGDWIIRGVKGEVYPCQPDIFAATYDEVPTDA